MRGRRGKHWVLGWRGSSYGPVLDTRAEHNMSETAWDKPARKLYCNYRGDDSMKLLQSQIQNYILYTSMMSGHKLGIQGQ